jgi:hypothetical protein
VGNVIGQSNKVRYYHEPFHPARGNKHNPIKQFFKYIPETNNDQDSLEEYFKKLKQFKVPCLYDVSDIRNSRKISFFWHPLAQIISTLLQQTPLIKDPPSLLMLEWVAKNYEVDIVVVLRHPAAFVNSAKKVGWHFGMNTFLQQDSLMRDYLGEYKEEMIKDLEERTNNEFSVSNSLLFWRMMHSIIYQYSIKHPEWYFVKHEQLSKEPIIGFNKLFKYLGLPFTTRVGRYLQNSSVVGTKGQSRLKRNSASLVKQWKGGLSQEEIDLIKSVAQKEWSLFYDESDW